MTTRQAAITVPEKVLLAEKTDEQAFAKELRMLAAVKLYELGRSGCWPSRTPSGNSRRWTGSCSRVATSSSCSGSLGRARRS